MYAYYTQHDVKLFDFFMIPKELVRDKKFSTLSTDAKILYGIMMERLTLSQKNSWIDEQGRVYIIYTIDTLMDDMNCKSTKAFKLMKELEAYELIERKRRGLSRPNLIYVKNFASQVPGKYKNVDKADEAFETAENACNPSGYADIREREDLDIRSCEGQDIREDPDVRKREGQDIRECEGHDIRERESLTSANANTNNNNINIIKEYHNLYTHARAGDTEMDVSQLIMAGETCTDRSRTEYTLKTNLGYEQLVTALPNERETADLVFQVLIDLFSGQLKKPFTESSCCINGACITARQMRQTLSKLNEGDIYGILKRLSGKQIANRYAYIMNSLYNAAEYKKREDHVYRHTTGTGCANAQPFYNLEQRDVKSTVQLLESLGGDGAFGYAV